MKSRNLIENILFIFLFAALACFIACSSSDDEKEDLTDTGTVSDEDSTDDAEPAGDTDSEPADDTDTASDDTDSADDSDTPAGDTDTDSEPTEPDEPTDPAEPTEPATEGCTMIEVPQITMGGSYADEINGYFSPEMGDSAIDIIKILLMGEIKEGTYQLGAGLNDNYAQCEQCVMVWVDAALAAANEYYFQTHGTLTITEVRDVDGIQRTAGRIENLILKQAEANEYMSDFTLIPDGKCIAAEIVEWDTTNTPGNSGD